MVSVPKKNFALTLPKIVFLTFICLGLGAIPFVLYKYGPVCCRAASVEPQPSREKSNQIVFQNSAPVNPPSLREFSNQTNSPPTIKGSIPKTNQKDAPVVENQNIHSKVVEKRRNLSSTPDVATLNARTSVAEEMKRKFALLDRSTLIEHGTITENHETMRLGPNNSNRQGTIAENHEKKKLGPNNSDPQNEITRKSVSETNPDGNGKTYPTATQNFIKSLYKRKIPSTLPSTPLNGESNPIQTSQK